MLNRARSTECASLSSRLRKAILPFVGFAALAGGVYYTADVYSDVNEPTTTADGRRIGIIDAAREYLGPDGDGARCTDRRLAVISRKVAAIPDGTADELLENGGLEVQAIQFNSLGANEITADDLHALLTNTPQTPDTQCDREGGTSTSELLAKAPLGLFCTWVGSLVISLVIAGRVAAARANRGRNGKSDVDVLTGGTE